MCVFVYMTAPDLSTARELSRAVVEARLAACANILGKMEAVFFWDGKVQEEAEVAVLLKTAASQVDALTARLVELHPYEVPCVVHVPLSGGHAPFLDWVRGQNAES